MTARIDNIKLDTNDSWLFEKKVDNKRAYEIELEQINKEKVGIAELEKLFSFTESDYLKEKYDNHSLSVKVARYVELSRVLNSSRKALDFYEKVKTHVKYVYSFESQYIEVDEDFKGEPFFSIKGHYFNKISELGSKADGTFDYTIFMRGTGRVLDEVDMFWLAHGSEFVLDIAGIDERDIYIIIHCALDPRMLGPKGSMTCNDYVKHRRIKLDSPGQKTTLGCLHLVLESFGMVDHSSGLSASGSLSGNDHRQISHITMSAVLNGILLFEPVVDLESGRISNIAIITLKGMEILNGMPLYSKFDCNIAIEIYPDIFDKLTAKSGNFG